MECFIRAMKGVQYSLPTCSIGLVYLLAWMVDFFIGNVGKYTSLMEHLGSICIYDPYFLFQKLKQYLCQEVHAYIRCVYAQDICFNMIPKIKCMPSKHPTILLALHVAFMDSSSRFETFFSVPRSNMSRRQLQIW